MTELYDYLRFLFLSIGIPALPWMVVSSYPPDEYPLVTPLFLILLILFIIRQRVTRVPLNQK